jgi:hypothetical protein
MMRLSLLVGVLAVTSLASLVLGGCAADAETADDEPAPNVALIAPATPVAPIDRTSDARQTASVSGLLPPHLSDAARARQGETWSEAALGRLEAHRYGEAPSESLGH